jgi:error-prone DNA polymerase
VVGRCRRHPAAARGGRENVAALKDLKAIYGRRGYMALFQRRRPGDAVASMRWRGRRAGRRRAVVTGDVLYHAPEARLQDVVTAVRENAPSTSWAIAAR